MAESSYPWWNQEECGLHYFLVRYYNLDIYIGGRPCHKGTTIAFSAYINTWINLSDRLHDEYTVPDWSPQMYWYPLIEDDTPLNWGWKIVYWFSRIMDRELGYAKHKERRFVYIHCDGGTHRSPTLVYMWLVDLLGREKALKVMNDREIVPDNDYHRRNFTDPDAYLDGHIANGTIPPDKERSQFLRVMRSNGFHGVEDVLRNVEYENKYS